MTIPGTLYRALMNSDHKAEIRASVAAQAFMVLLIWVAIAIVNVVYARRS